MPAAKRANAKARAAAKKKAKRNFKQSKSSVGILVTEELETAIDQCREKVKTIARMCRARNQKFR